MTLDDARLQVAEASRILYAQGVVDAFGHVSMRSPERPDRFLMSRSMAPATVEPSDVIEHDFQGEPVGEPGARVFLERFIHAEIYRARPDVGAVAHSHSANVVPFTVVKTAPLRPVCHICGFLAGLPPVFDIADAAGPGSDLLIRNADLGRAFSAHLGGANVALMRGHGFTAVGAALSHAVFRAVYTAVNGRLQETAMRLGEPQYLTDEEALACERATVSQMDRAWSLWRSELSWTPAG